MSIKDHALLVSLTVRKPQLTKKDDKATHDAEVANDASGAGQYRKDLYPKSLIAPIIAAESAARSYLLGPTYEWAGGTRLLPMPKFMEVTEALGRYEIQFNQSVTVFMNNWSNVLTAARQQQGDMFDATIYPSLADLRSRFAFQVSYAPVTDVGDFRVGLQEKEIELLRHSVEREMKQATDQLMKEPLIRLREVIQRLAAATGQDRLVMNKRTGASEVRAAVFRDTLVENIVDEIALLRDFAAVLPEEVVSLADVVDDTCTPLPEALRVDPELRHKTNVNAKNILAAIEELL